MFGKTREERRQARDLRRLKKARTGEEVERFALLPASEPAHQAALEMLRKDSSPLRLYRIILAYREGTDERLRMLSLLRDDEHLRLLANHAEDWRVVVAAVNAIGSASLLMKMISAEPPESPLRMKALERAVDLAGPAALNFQALTARERAHALACTQDQLRLSEFVRQNRSRPWAAEAFARITDEAALRDIAAGEETGRVLTDRFVTHGAPPAPDARLFALVLDSGDELVKDWAIANLSGQPYLRLLALAEPDSLRRCAVLRKIRDDGWLAARYAQEGDALARSAILDAVVDPAIRAGLIAREPLPELRQAAAGNVVCAHSGEGRL